MRPYRVLLAAGLTTLVVAAPASAATFCVGEDECPAGATQQPDVPTAAKAAASADGADLIRVGGGTFVLGAAPVQLRGADVLQGADGGGTTLEGTLDLAGTTVVRDVTLQLPASATTGVVAAGGRLERTEIDGAAVTAADALGVSATAPTEVRDVTVELPTGTALDGAVRVQGATLRAATGLRLASGAMVERAAVEATRAGVLAPDGGVGLDAVSVRLTGADTTGVAVGPAGAGSVPSTLTHLTVLGDGAAGGRGLVVRGGCGDGATSVTVAETAIGAVATAIDRGGECASGAAAAADLTVTASAYDAGVVRSEGAGVAELEPPVTTDLGLDDDLVPLPGSKLIDAGDSGEVAGLDVAGQPRPADGDGDGFAAPDLGAAELAQQPLSDAYGLGDAYSDYGYDPGYGDDYSDDDGDRVRKRRPKTLRLKVRRAKGAARRFTVEARLTYPRRTSPRGGRIALDAWAGKRHLAKRRAKLDRRGRATFTVRVPKGVPLERVGLQAAFGGTRTLAKRTSRWVGLS